MNAKKAKKLRKLVYQESSIRARSMVTHPKTNQVIHHPESTRAQYQRIKKSLNGLKQGRELKVRPESATA